MRIVVLALMIGWSVPITGPIFAQEVPAGLVVERSSASGQKNTFDTPQDAEQGKMTFITSGGCAYCHGNDGSGGRGANLTNGEYRYGGSDAQLFETIRNGIAGSDMPPTRGPDPEIWRLVTFVKRLGSQGLSEKAPGNPSAGKIVYDNQGCAGCHAVNNQGGIIGPDLSQVGRRRSLRFLEESLTKPEADLPLNYRSVRVETTSGQSVTGIRLNEDDISIQLREMSGNLRAFLKSDVKQIRRDKPSLMPAYGSAMSKKEMEDLIAYLSSLRGAR